MKRVGTPRTGADRTNGVALASARQRKERTDPEGGRAIGGAREAPFLLESSVKAAWVFRWSCMLACTAARSFSLSLVGVSPRAWMEPCRHCAMFCLTTDFFHSFLSSKKKKTGAVYASLEDNLCGHAGIRNGTSCLCGFAAGSRSGLVCGGDGIWAAHPRTGHSRLAGDVQSAWMMLLHCALARANCHLRVPELTLQFATPHDQHLWNCLCQILGISTSAAHATTKADATLPLALGGLGCGVQ